MRLLLLVVVLLSLTACEKKLNPGDAGGGVGVGNGMHSTEVAVYYSPKYQYGFKYAADLDVTKISDEKLKIHNATLLRSQGLGGVVTPSALEVETVIPPRKLVKVEDILDYANDLHRTEELEFIPITEEIPGAKGVVAKNKIFYFLTSNDTLIRLRLDLHTEHVSWKDIENIVKTFTYDGKPPVVRVFDLHPLSKRGFAGMTGTLLVEASDDFAGLLGGHVSVLFVSQKSDTAHVLNGEVDITEKNYDPKRGLIHVDFDIPKWINHGVYILLNLKVTDAAGNEADIWYGDNPKHDPNNLLDIFLNPKQTYIQKVDDVIVHNYNRLSVAFGVLNLLNKGDVEAPRVQSFKLDAAKYFTSVESPELKVQVDMEATDDSSGVMGGEVILSFRQEEGEEKGRSIYGIHRIVKEDLVGKDRYRFQVSLGRNLPAGKYKSDSVDVKDRSTALPNFVYGLIFGLDRKSKTSIDLAFELESNGSYDHTDPVIEAIEFDRDEISPSQPGILSVKISDNLSGMVRGRLNAMFAPVDPKKNESAKIQVKFDDLPPEMVVDGYVRVPIKASPYIPKGEYGLVYLTIEDAARNYVSLHGAPIGKRSPFFDLMQLEVFEPKQHLEPYERDFPVIKTRVVP